MKNVLYRTLLLAALFTLSACSLFQSHLTPPEVVVANLRLGPGEGFYQMVYVDLMITNPNSTAVRLDAISYRLRVQGRELVSGTSREPLDIPAGGSTKYTVPASFSLLSGLSFIKDLLMRPQDKVRYELEATLEPSGIFSLPITVKKSDVIDLTH